MKHKPITRHPFFLFLCYILIFTSLIAIAYLSQLDDYRPYLFYVILSGAGLIGGTYFCLKSFME